MFHISTWRIVSERESLVHSQSIIWLFTVRPVIFLKVEGGVPCQPYQLTIQCPPNDAGLRMIDIRSCHWDQHRRRNLTTEAGFPNVIQKIHLSQVSASLRQLHATLDAIPSFSCSFIDNFVRRQTRDAVSKRGGSAFAQKGSKASRVSMSKPAEGRCGYCDANFRASRCAYILALCRERFHPTDKSQHKAHSKFDIE